jgi:hypothetical protein
MSHPIIYTAELDYPQADLAHFADWYAYRHAPNLYEAGFRTCTCYRAVTGGMDVIDIYEAESAAVFDAPRYRAMGPKDPYVAEILTKRLDKAHTVYDQLLIAPPAPPGETPALDADWISLIRFAAATATDDRIAAWLGDGETARLFALGAKRLRFAQRTGDHPVYTTHRPRCLFLIEWPERPPRDADTQRRMSERFGNEISDVDTFVGYRLYPWPDKPA